MNKNIKTKALEVVSDPRVMTGILCSVAGTIVGACIMGYHFVSDIVDG